MSTKEANLSQSIEELSLKSQQLRNKIHLLLQEKLEIDDTIEKLWGEKKKRTTKKRLLDILNKEEIMVGNYNQNVWKHFTNKPITGRRGKKEDVIFRAAVAVWLAPLLTNREISEAFGVDVSTISYWYRMFLDERRITEITREVGPIQTLIKKFNQWPETQDSIT